MKSRTLLTRVVPVHLLSVTVAVAVGLAIATAGLRFLEGPQQTLTLLLGAILIVAAVTGSSLWAFARLGKPLRAVRTAARHYADGDLDFRLSIEEPSELGELAEALNSMAAQLKWRIATISRQHSELEAILSSMVEGVVVLDAANRVRSANEAAARLARCRPSEAIGRSLLDVFRSSELAAVADEVAIASGPIERNITIYLDDLRMIQVHGTPLRSDADPRLGLLLVLHDITRLKRLEDIRKDFVANVSHELKTPITSIAGYAETVSEIVAAQSSAPPDAAPPPDAATAADTTTAADAAQDSRLQPEAPPTGEDSQHGSSPGALEEATRFLDAVRRNTERLNAIIEDLLSLSRLEQTDLEIPRESTDLAGPVKRVVETWRAAAAENAVRLDLALSPHCTAEVDAGLIEQAVDNLVGNAVKYGESGGTVTISLHGLPEAVEIAVADDGPGIPPYALSRIFERFYRVDRARSRKLGGTGLGLAIVKHIALAHGGSVDVRSTVGTGSTFTLRIPRAAGSDRAVAHHERGER